MADDQNQRPYRSNEAPARRAPAATAASGSDPLAELARLIGQTDPFGEFGRDNARRAAAPQPAAPPAAPSFGANDYFGPATAPAPHPPMPQAAPYGAPGFARQPYAPAGELYQDEDVAPGQPATDSDGFEPDSYPLSNAQLGGEEVDFYEDAPPAKRRMGVMAIAAVFALAVIGTAGAFGYRALFGSSHSSAPPPVIKADTAPSKIVPAAASKTPNKLITDRVSNHVQGEKIVSREEQPVAIKNNPAPAPMPPAQSSPPLAAPQAALGSGVISSEPKKVHTIAIHPDQASMGESQPAAAPAPAPPAPPQAAAPAPIKQAPPPTHVASNPPIANAPEPPPRPTETRAAAPVHRVTASAPSNAPLSLSPDAPARAPMRTASVTAPAPIARAAKPAAAAAKGSYAVQVSSQRSEAEAQAAFRSLQAKYPNQLGGRQALIHKVELGAKGTYYRAMVGPFATANEASTMCGGLKAAGGSCIVQRN